MAKGGARPGAGRKPVHDEIHARQLAQGAIIKKFGSLEAGLEFLLATGEPTLMKFVYEHAIGKPTEQHKIEGELKGFNLNVIMPDGH